MYDITLIDTQTLDLYIHCNNIITEFPQVKAVPPYQKDPDARKKKEKKEKSDKTMIQPSL